MSQSNRTKLKISLLTGGQDIHYALGLLSGLTTQPLDIEFIGNDYWQDACVVKSKNVTYYNLRGDQTVVASLKEKIIRVLKYYFKLVNYAAKTDSRLFHILWLNKFVFIDRTLLNLYYKALGKKIIFTAHDINYRKLAGSDTLMNSLSLKFMYRIVDHIIVHTEKMKMELVESYHVKEKKISIIPFGINEVMPITDLTREQARKRLNLSNQDKILLFFGNIAPYKGLEFLILSLVNLRERYKDLKLIIAGRIKVDCQEYWIDIKNIIKEHGLEDIILQRIEYIPEVEAEVYFKAADVLILPYKNIFQSGLIYTSYRFGLSVVAADTGSLKDDVIIGKTGFICKSEDPEDLANKVIQYFNSDLFKDLDGTREKIIQQGKINHSWELTGERTFDLYRTLL
ncbi:MAG: glycosyltransferase family 4 protein [Acidobacteriota bacterium]|jgi:glycosyltransferase involved in cell wall biosynthesis